MNQKVQSVVKELLKEKGSFRIKLLGDSITHGYGGTGYAQDGEPIVEHYRRSPNAYCWASLLAKYMKEKYECEVINNGCSGTTLHFVYSHFDELVEEEDDLILCMIGTNNRNQYKEKGYVTPEERKEYVYNKIFALHEKMVKSKKKFILMASIPASAKREMDADAYWCLIHMDDINAIYKKAEEVLDFPFISLYDLFSDHCKKENIPLDSLLEDGLHPNDRGYEIMFSLLVKELGV